MDYIGADAGRLRDGVVDGRSLGSGAEATKETTHGSLSIESFVAGPWEKNMCSVRMVVRFSY